MAGAGRSIRVMTLPQRPRSGFFPVDLGSLDVGGRLASLPFGALAAHNFIKI
ncbi:hypothetical protein QCM77_31645 [Bradyrhizobium sp. SSUT18]|uniref:hypothetical protein n=1 Tax=unclassified Bradyrhizobium TaxID=2631580 RepID=UPI00244AC915|nr:MULTISPECIES: hypothetical protein [unclassified Bradyrhizobium]MDH2356266.1 hypothetical protein [Bradyrhizobium sp. SSUT112]MDH2404473.1 hypothetical protein [Bradyrhizobium sp. SSUT18]